MSGHCNEAWFTEIRSELCLLNSQLDMNKGEYYNWPWYISLESQLQVLQCFRASGTVKTKVPWLFCFTLGLGDPDFPVFPTHWPIRTNHLAHICFVFLFSSQNSKLQNVPAPRAPYLSTHMVSPAQSPIWSVSNCVGNYTATPIFKMMNYKMIFFLYLG